MKRPITRIALRLFAAAFFLPGLVMGQTKRPAVRPVPPKPVIFAVLNGALEEKWIEPIAVVDKGKLAEAMTESEAKSFEKNYYKAQSIYAVIFGGAQDGLATIVKSNIGSECGGSSAVVSLKSTKAKLAPPVFALATNVRLKPDAKSYRRRPTPAERAEIEKLVRAEFVKNGASATAAKTLHYHNLTALDIDGNDSAEFVGSYWLAPTPKERRLLFFITGRAAGDAIMLEHSEHSVVKPDDVMSGDLKDVDEGRGAELLVDLLDYDGDGTKEIFTIGQAFEGNNYYVYKRTNGKWTKVIETYNYRCAY
jgi:hypothetical protein